MAYLPERSYSSLDHVMFAKRSWIQPVTTQRVILVAESCSREISCMPTLKKKIAVLTSVNVTKLAHGGPENFRNPRCNGKTPRQHQNVSRKRHRSSRRRELERNAEPVAVPTDESHNLHLYTRCVPTVSDVRCDKVHLKFVRSTMEAHSETLGTTIDG